MADDPITAAPAFGARRSPHKLWPGELKSRNQGRLVHLTAPGATEKKQLAGTMFADLRGTALREQPFRLQWFGSQKGKSVEIVEPGW